MRVIGITGSIACGKSTVCAEISRRGYPVIDADLLSRELTVPGGPVMKEIRAAFGERYIQSDGSLNRREMGRLVFSEPRAKDRLDRIMAPYLKTLTLERIEKIRASGALLCFLDYPLLYEKGYDRYCDTVWCVWLPEDLQLQRLMDRNGYTREEAYSRMRAALSSDEKANRSPVVIDNSGPLEDTVQQIEDQLNTELSRSGSVPRRRRSAGTVPESFPFNHMIPVQPSVSAPPSVSVGQPSQAPVSAQPIGFERPESGRKKASNRKTAWQIPVWIRVSLISLAVILALSFTAQMLMNAYLTNRQQEHEDEQRAIDEQYPLMYVDEIKKIAAEYNLSPSLIAAVIRNESSFRPTVESSVGARGLMQLMPDTSEWIAHKLRLDDYRFDKLYDPETNIRFGCWYLNYLSTLFNGNPLCVVCAYHAGQGEIASWLANPLYSTDGVTLNADNLPEGPTKQYAGRVIRDYGIYHAKYFDQTVSDSAADNAAGSR